MNAEGLGLGLNICHNIVKKNGGYIEAHSNGENQGSTFMFGMKMQQIPIITSNGRLQQELPENFADRLATIKEVDKQIE